MSTKKLAILDDSGTFRVPDGSSFRLGTDTSNIWLEVIKSFRYENASGNFTIRKGKGGWYVFKNLYRKLHSAYVSSPSDLSIQRLEIVIEKLLVKAEEHKPPTPALESSRLDKLEAQLNHTLVELRAQLSHALAEVENLKVEFANYKNCALSK